MRNRTAAPSRPPFLTAETRGATLSTRKAWTLGVLAAALGLMIAVLFWPKSPERAPLRPPEPTPSQAAPLPSEEHRVYRSESVILEYKDPK